MCLIGELMPRLPSDGLFSVDCLFDDNGVYSAIRASESSQQAVERQWRDDVLSNTSPLIDNQQTVSNSGVEAVVASFG